ncbi:MAG: hypothetical protein ACRD0Q_04915, partial [Acidimicrobiales bacterium]
MTRALFRRRRWILLGQLGLLLALTLSAGGAPARARPGGHRAPEGNGRLVAAPAAAPAAAASVPVSAPTRRTAVLRVVAVVANDNGGAREVPDFPLFVDALPVTSGQRLSVAPGPHHFSG